MEIGGGDHSPELHLALKKFEDACSSLENEQSKLLELEKRRKRLQEDLECLRNEILIEKSHIESVKEENNEIDMESTIQSNRTSNEVDNQSLPTNEIEGMDARHQ